MPSGMWKLLTPEFKSDLIQIWKEEQHEKGWDFNERFNPEEMATIEKAINLAVARAYNLGLEDAENAIRPEASWAIDRIRKLRREI